MIENSLGGFPIYGRETKDSDVSLTMVILHKVSPQDIGIVTIKEKVGDNRVGIDAPIG